MVGAKQLLVGRQSEVAVLASLLAGARAPEGRSGALVLRGEPGIGKSALLADAVAAADGFRVLRAVGREAETSLSFAGLADLFRPVLNRIGELPRPQAAALAGALAVGPPVPGDRFTVAAGALSLLAAVAEQQPVLTVVDDAHWLDPASREALLFASRRLCDEAVVVLFAVRPDEGKDVDWLDLEILRVEGIDRRSSGALLEQATGRLVAEAVTDRLCAAAAGNPLAMLKMARALSDEQLAGIAELADLPAAPSVQEAFHRRISALPGDCVRALVVAAADDALPAHQILAACGVLELRSDSLALAQAPGIITIGTDRLSFSHPIMRRAVYEGAADSDRRAAHHAIATVLDTDAAGERRAWHLAQAAVGPNRVAAAAVERSAIGAVARNAPAIAANLFSRAAELSADAGDRERLLIEAARHWQMAGLADRSSSVLDHVARTVDPLRRADAQRLRAAVDASHGHVDSAARLLVDEAAAVEQPDPERAIQMLLDACSLTWLSGKATASVPIARRAYMLAAHSRSPSSGFARMTLGTSLVLCGERDPGRELILDHATDPDVDAPLIMSAQGLGLMWSGELARAHDYLERLCVRARAASAPSQLCPALVRRSQVRFRLGWWPAAYADACESLRLARETGQRLFVYYSLALMALVESARGDNAYSAHAMEAIELAEGHGVGAVRFYGLAALGHGALAAGLMTDAIPPLENLEQLEIAAGIANPSVFCAAPDLIEAYIRAGRPDQARERLDKLIAEASRNASSWGLASAYRCEGMLAPSTECDSWFERALAIHDDVPSVFERARTQLCYGERLRRARRLSDAQEHLTHALCAFDQHAATRWAERARGELRAAGASPKPRRADRGAEKLTPQELRVALVIGDGATVREAANQLFLSPKTIEAHLGRAYRKLGVRNRAQLARCLAGDKTSPGSITSVEDNRGEPPDPDVFGRHEAAVRQRFIM
jgi:DNA-binding CsgD family transcriptional regulator